MSVFRHRIATMLVGVWSALAPVEARADDDENDPDETETETAAPSPSPAMVVSAHAIIGRARHGLPPPTLPTTSFPDLKSPMTGLTVGLTLPATRPAWPSLHFDLDYASTFNGAIDETMPDGTLREVPVRSHGLRADVSARWFPLHKLPWLGAGPSLGYTGDQLFSHVALPFPGITGHGFRLAAIVTVGKPSARFGLDLAPELRRLWLDESSRGAGYGDTVALRGITLRGRARVWRSLSVIAGVTMLGDRSKNQTSPTNRDRRLLWFGLGYDGAG